MTDHSDECSSGCALLPTSPGQSHTRLMDRLVWARLTIEGLCKRVVELEEQVQQGEPRVIEIGRQA